MAHIPLNAHNQHSGIVGALPTIWAGTTVTDGTVIPWSTAGIGSEFTYLDLTNGVERKFRKMKNNAATNDWSTLTHCIVKTVAYSAFTDGGGTSGTFALGETIPVGAWVLQAVLVDVTGFTGNTSAVIIVGDGTTTNRYNTGTPSVFTTATAIDLGVPSGTKIHTAAATITITVTSATDFTLVTAGSLTLRLYYLA